MNHSITKLNNGDFKVEPQKEKKKSRRVKVGFGELELTPLDPELIAKAQKSMNAHMKKVLQEERIRQAKTYKALHNIKFK